MKDRSISTRLFLNLIIIIFLVDIVLIVFIKSFVSDYLTTQIINKNLSIGKTLTNDCIEPILTNNLIKAKELIDNARKSETDFNYIYILDKQFIPLISTFSEGFPEELTKINILAPLQNFRVQLLDTGKEIIREIAIPILSGNLGSLHIGISENNIRKTVNSLIYKVIIIITGILLIGLVAVYLFVKNALSPLDKISKAFKEIGAGNFKQKIEVEGDSEIGLLTKSFNEMTEELENTKESLIVAQNQLLQNAKLSTIGQFAAGIAHEINNPLGAVINYIRTSLANPEVKSQIQGHLELSLKGLFRIENIIKQILDYSGRQRSELKTVNINQLIKDTFPFVEHRLLEHGIKYKMNLSDNLSYVMTDSNQLHQVFINIINNAIDAMDEKGELIIETYNKGREIVIVFTDNGCGINKEILDKIFDPFYTTKDVGKGIGLGLFISYNIIQTHHGIINIESKEGKGTKVIITFPAVNK